MQRPCCRRLTSTSASGRVSEPVPSATTSASSQLSTGLTLLAIAVASVVLRWPGMMQGGFGSHDVAGMLHEAMVLRDGGLPYVDTISVKAPGTFWLAAWLAGPDGIDIARFQRWAAAFGVASLLIVSCTAWRVLGRGAAIGAAILYGLHDLHLDNIDANYVTWAQTPMVAAAGLALVAVTMQSARGRGAVFAAAGFMAGLAALCKRQPGLVILVVFAIAVFGPAGSSPRARAKPHRQIAARFLASRWFGASCVLAGLVVAYLPIVVRYANAGQLPALWDGYVFSRWGLSYVMSGGQSGGGSGVGEGVLATTHFLALPLALAVFSAATPATAAERRTTVMLVIWAAVMLAAAWIGFRFYKGYFLAVLPPLCLLAAAPWGLLGRRGVLRREWLRALLLLPALVLVARQAMFLDQLRRNRAQPRDQGGRTIAAHIGPRMQPDDRIWVWGWHLWDVYALTGHRSASRLYKSIGLLTPPNDDTWRTGPTKATFVDGPAAAILLEDLRAAPPAWIVLGSTVPRREFTALRKFLRQGYRRDRRVRLGRVQFWHRRDRAEQERR